MARMPCSCMSICAQTLCMAFIMKAIIMAGGQGSRLRPISANMPKPMTSLFDKPIMEHIVNLLKSHGITDIAATLMFMPQKISDYFGDGRDFGVDMRYFVEQMPLGTAGSVGQCRDFVGDEDVLIISGDAVCNFDLTRAIEFHKEKNAAVTVVEYCHPAPLEYGLVMTDKTGRIERFIEKPSWAQVFTNTVNTGIYILKPQVLEQIPQNVPYDFAKDLFAKMMSQGQPMYAVTLGGYWCDLGDGAAYLTCVQDALAGKIPQIISAPQVREGIYSHIRLPDDFAITAPCYIGKNVNIAPTATIKGGCAIGKNSIIQPGAVLDTSVCAGGIIHQNARLERAIVCRGAVIKQRSQLMPGSIIGSDAVVGENSIIHSGVRVWPDMEIADGSEIRKNIISASGQRRLIFEENAVLTGEINIDILPQTAASLGAACAGTGGLVCVAADGAPAAEAFLPAFVSGACLAGGNVLVHDGQTVTTAGFAATAFNAKLSVFIAQRGNRVEFSITDALGLPVGREIQRKIETELACGDYSKADAAHITTTKDFSGINDLYLAKAAAFGSAEGFTVSAEGCPFFARALTDIGCKVTTGQVPLFQLSNCGRYLTAMDEDGFEVGRDKLQAAAAYVFLKSHPGQSLGADYNTPVTLEVIAAQFGGRVLRIGRDQGARELVSAQRILCDGIFQAIYIIDHLHKTGQTLSGLISALPSYTLISKLVDIDGDKAAIMRKMAQESQNMRRELFEGVRVCVDNGWVNITPQSAKEALRLTVEAESEEIAQELCAMYEGKIKGAQGL